MVVLSLVFFFKNIFSDSSQELQAVTETSKQHEQNNRILLEEVETQEFEIERLFKENSHLHSQLEELATVTRDWQAQVT